MGKKLRTVEELSGKAGHGGTMMDYAIGSPVNFFLFGFRRQILSTSYIFILGPYFLRMKCECKHGPKRTQP